MSGEFSRRGFLKQGGLYGAGLWLGLHVRPQAAAAAAASRDPETLTPAEWASLEAMTGRILPSVDGPGAIEAGCVNFIDKALAREDAAALPLYRGGLAALDAACQAKHGAGFAALPAAAQDAMLHALERGDVSGWPEALPAPVFFETVRLHTIVGFLADPKYGGNRDHAGWQVTGYPGPRHRMGGYSPDQVEGRTPIVPIWKRA